MREKNYPVMAACLIHDVGKVLYRAGVGSGNHSVRGANYLKEFAPKALLGAVRYHHGAELAGARLESDDPAYIAYMADNISAGADRRDRVEGESEAGFARHAAMESIFDHIGKVRGNATFTVDKALGGVQFPEPCATNDAAAYEHVLRNFTEGLKGIEWHADYANSLIELCGRCFAYVPSSTAVGERCDVSLYHHSKTTAAVGCCIRMYLESCGRRDLKRELLTNARAFMDEKAFLLVSLDVSGIQSFIYTLSDKGALKNLRARSFYLTILPEDIVDGILEALGLFRTNLIYCGGGRAHLLLPNTQAAIDTVGRIVFEANEFLRKRFGTALYLAWGHCACSGNDLTSNGGRDDAFSKLFRETSLRISRRKLCRYDAGALLELNGRDAADDGRECVICGASGKLVKVGDRELCATCRRLEQFAEAFREDSDLLIVSRDDAQGALPLTGGRYVYPATEQKTREILRTQPEDVVRLYGVNKSYTGLKLATCLPVGNYSVAHADGTRLSFHELAERSRGVSRLGVLRADVDDLGALFARGFYDEGARNPWRFATLSRYTALSMSLTDFFRHEINRIVRGDPQKPRNVSIVYAGGDDVFLIGAWNEVLDAGIAVRDEFRRYTGGAVTLSAGFGFYKEHTPVAVMADAAAELEDDAKHMKGGAKNAVSLFEPGHHAYPWDDFTGDVLREKLDIVRGVMTSDDDNGNAFLYSVVGLLRDVKPNSMAVARLAYALARHEPGRHASAEAREHYQKFQSKVYQWAMSPEDNRRLQTAILYHVYTASCQNL